MLYNMLVFFRKRLQKVFRNEKKTIFGVYILPKIMQQSLN